MSTIIFCVYIIVGIIFFILCFCYKLQRFAKFAKRKLAATVANVDTNLNIDNNKMDERGIWSIPGPLILPFLGTKWIFFWRYKMNKIHQVYEGKGIILHI